MTPRGRILLFGISAAVLAAMFVASLRVVPAVGKYPGPYGDVLNGMVVYERHVTNVVTAVNFDVRAMDTLIEESILFLSVAGTVVLLRHMYSDGDQKKSKGGDDNKEDKGESRSAPYPSDTVRGFALLLVGPMVVFGLYIASHGQLTPGGGFQGGVIVATAFLLLYIAGDFSRFRELFSHTAIAIIEAAGLLAFLVIGIAGMLQGHNFLQNVFPLGTTGDVLSGGTIFALTCFTCFAVATGILKVIYAFLEQVLQEWSE